MPRSSIARRWAGAAASLLVALCAGTASAQTGTLTEVTSFGANPSQLRMYLYRPTSLPAKPAVVVAIHWCHGDGMAMYNGSEYARLADKYGYLVIYPSVTQASDGCFDVASTATLTHDGGSDSLGIVSMVRYVLQTYGADSGRVYATGVSSGAMMTNVLLGAYPDVFKAGAAFAGVPFGCFAGPNSWNADCAQGKITKTAQQWGDLVRAAYPGYGGPRPRMQLWHGTSDEVLSYVNFGEEIEQWTDVLGVSATPVTTEPNTPESNWTRTRYGSAGEGAAVEAISLPGVVHNLPVRYAAAIHFFGLDTATPDIQPPTTPMNLASPAQTSTSVSLTWSASADDVAVTGYDVFNGTQLAASVAGTSAVVTGLTPNTTYSFTVRARDAMGNVSARSAALAVTTSQDTGDIVPPTTPGTPVASNVGSTSLTLTWTASTDNVGVVGYDVYSRTSAGDVKVASPTYATAALTGLAPTTAYTFYVRARDAAGAVSPASATVAVTTLADQTGSAISVNAGGAASGAFAADAYYTGGNTASAARTIDTSLLSGTIPPQAVFQTERWGNFTYTLPNLTPGSAYTVTLYFAEIYWSAAGQRKFDVSINGTTVLSAFDVFTAAGGANKAIARPFSATANANGQVVIAFAKGAGIDNPKVSGITVAGGGAPPTTYALTVARTGTGSGTVAGGAIACGATCTASVASGTAVTLTATAAAGSTFTGWSGACSGTSPTCAVSMTAARSVGAAFDAGTPPTDGCKAVSGGQSGNFGTTGASCFTVSATIHGWGCSNVDGRTLTVNGTATTCGTLPLPGSAPYTFSFTAGSYPWASFYWW